MVNYMIFNDNFSLNIVGGFIKSLALDKLTTLGARGVFFHSKAAFVSSKAAIKILVRARVLLSLSS